MTLSHNSARVPADQTTDDLSPGPLHKVVVFAVPDDPSQLRDLLVDRLQMNPVDAQIQVHGLPGVLPVAVSQHQAAALAAAVRELGVNATAIPLSDIPLLSDLTTVHHLRCCENELQVVGLRGIVQKRVPLSEVSLISVGLVPQSKPRPKSPTPTLAVSLASPHRSERDARVRHDNLELLIMGQDLCVRVDHAEMNYEYLGARMSTSATVNFRLLVQDLVSRAAAACVTPATRSFLEHGLARHYQFHSREEMQRYTEFHLILRESAVGQTVSREDRAEAGAISDRAWGQA